MQLTDHFSLEEMTRTRVEGVDNTPTAEAMDNLRRLCQWLELLREKWNRHYGEGDDPLIINSAYRSAAVNKAVGGVAMSNHLTGCAADIRVTGIEQLLRYATLVMDISDERGKPFDELLLERQGRTMWLHFAVRPTSNRRRISICVK